MSGIFVQQPPCTNSSAMGCLGNRDFIRVAALMWCKSINATIVLFLLQNYVAK